jgi:hypothetical protein
MFPVMASPHLSTTLAEFTAVVQRGKNRLVAVPAASQRTLGLARRQENHILACSIRRAGHGRWNHRLVKLTFDNEFSLPGDVGLVAGDKVDVKVHRIIADVAIAAPVGRSPADPLLELAASAGDDPRVDGSDRVDEYLVGQTP